MPGYLGRNYPKHFDNVESFPLRDRDLETPKIQPVPIGINWYSSFDEPIKQPGGTYTLKASRLGYIRGGHCVCTVPPAMLAKDTVADWQFYDQKQEGACVGFGHARRFSLL